MNYNKGKKLITITYNDLGISWGPSVHFLELWTAFHRQYHNVYELIGISPSWTKKLPIIPTDFKLYQIKLYNIRFIRQLLYDFILFFYITKYRKNIFYFRTSNFSFFTLLALKLYNIRPIIEMNGTAETDFKGVGNKSLLYKMSLFTERFFIKQSSKCIVVSEGIANYCKNKKAKSVKVIYNGISRRFFETTQKKDFTKLKAVYVGTYTPWDGADNIPILAEKYPEVAFHLYGKLIAKKDNTQTNLFYHDKVPYADLPTIYSQYDIGIALYDDERNKDFNSTSSMKVLEYIASGLAVYVIDTYKGQQYINENKIGITTSNLKQFEDFQLVIDNINLFKQNCNQYRKEFYEMRSWEKSTALDTYNYINKEN